MHSLVWCKLSFENSIFPNFFSSKMFFSNCIKLSFENTIFLNSQIEFHLVCLCLCICICNCIWWSQTHLHVRNLQSLISCVATISIWVSLGFWSFENSAQFISRWCKKCSGKKSAPSLKTSKLPSCHNIEFSLIFGQWPYWAWSWSRSINLYLKILNCQWVKVLY